MMPAFSWTLLARSAPKGGAEGIFFGSSPAMVAGELAFAERGFVYLASPYSKRVLDRSGQWDLGRSGRAAHDAAVEVGRLKEVAVTAVSPIVLSAALVHATLNPFSIRARPVPRQDPLDAAAWEAWCRPMLLAARAVVVPQIDGWDVSNGIRAEVMLALDRGIPVHVYAPSTLIKGDDGDR